jgi:twitching motility protein PilT
LPDDAVRNLIRQGKVEQIYSVMQTGTSKGMVTMEQSLAELVIRGIVSMDIAVTRSSRPEQLQGLLERAGFEDPNAPAAEENGHAPVTPAEPVFGGLRVSGS